MDSPRAYLGEKEFAYFVGIENPLVSAAAKCSHPTLQKQSFALMVARFASLAPMST